MNSNTDTNFKVIDNRSPDTRARVAEMPDQVGESDDAILRACPFCGSDPNVFDLDDYGVDKWVVQCGSCLTFMKGETKSAAIAAWNRRTPEPGTSVIVWHIYAGTPETLPEDVRWVLLAGPNIYRQCLRVRLNQETSTPRWEDDDADMERVMVGDLWAYLPTPPATVPALSSAPEPPPPSGNRPHAQ